MSVTDQEFSFLCNAPREVLLESLLRVWADYQELKNTVSVELLELPDCGEYIVKDGSGAVRMRVFENDYDLKDVETIASALSSKGAYCSVVFSLCEIEELISEWQNGKKVVRCK